MNVEASSSLDEADRNFFIQVYRAAVDVYKPRIEKKTGVALGDISVFEYSELIAHLLQEESPFSRALRIFFYGRRFPQYYEDALNRMCDEQASKCAACYRRSRIYVSFKSGTAHEEAVAATVVHELSHALWERLSSKPLSWRPRRKYRKKYQLFVEAFATYAEQVWFLDFYPVAARRVVELQHTDPQSIYFRGRRKIENLIREHGKDVLLQIPKHWRSL